MEFDRKVALVLGAARGIGKAYCQSLLEKGAKVSWACPRFEERHIVGPKHTAAYTRNCKQAYMLHN